MKIMRRFAVAIACAVAAAALAHRVLVHADAGRAADPRQRAVVEDLRGRRDADHDPARPGEPIEVPLARISPPMQQAVIAIEDERFYYHHGVDIRAIVRAARTNAEAGTVEQGGSTITQQLVKNTLLSSGKTLDRKIQEAALAWQLENHYSKQRILEIYLNTVYFGNGAYGVEAAAEQYFAQADRPDRRRARPRPSPGLIQAPNDYDPIAHPDAALARRNTVLDKMARARRHHAGRARHRRRRAARHRADTDVASAIPPPTSSTR